MIHGQHRPTPFSTPESGRYRNLRALLLTGWSGLVTGLVLAYVFQAGCSGAALGCVRLQPDLLQRAGLTSLARFAHKALASGLPSVLEVKTIPSEPAHTPVNAARIDPRREFAMLNNPSTASSHASLSPTQRVLSAGWSAPQNISSSPGASTNPVALTAADNTLHVLWEEDQRILHAARLNGEWSAPAAIATGQQPAASLADDGVVHVVYTNEFSGQFRVFYIQWQDGTWSLPRLVSKTTGLSALPSLAIDSEGVIHAVWADLTPGFSIIYHGWLEETWLNEPLHNARGTAPVLSHDPQGNALHVGWQSRGIGDGPYEVFHAQGTTYRWSLPENISVSPQNESVNAHLASDRQGVLHLVWQEHSESSVSIHYAAGREGNWTASEVISDQSVNAYGPVVLITHGNQLNVVWRQSNAVVYRRHAGGLDAWLPARVLVINDSGLDSVDLSSGSQGELHLVWSGWMGSTERDVFHCEHEPVLGAQVFLPHIEG